MSEGLAEALELLDRRSSWPSAMTWCPSSRACTICAATSSFRMGNIEGCREEHERGLGYARRSGSPEAEARALGGLADAAYAQGRMRTAFEYFSRCVALSREHGFGRIEVANRSMVGFSRLYLNEARQAREDGDAAARRRRDGRAAARGDARAKRWAPLPAASWATTRRWRATASGDAARPAARRAPLRGARRWKSRPACCSMPAAGRKLREMLREALAICREAGTQFSGPKVVGAFSRAVADPAERRLCCAKAGRCWRRGAVGHNHLWFHRDAIEAHAGGGRRRRRAGLCGALEDYTRAEPLPWSDLFAARGRVLATALGGPKNEAVGAELGAIRASLEFVGLAAFLPRVNAMIAS